LTREAADLVVAAGQHRAGQVTLGHGVDGLDQPAQRIHHAPTQSQVEQDAEGKNPRTRKAAGASRFP